MSKILAVFGASGQQGSSVVQHVLDDLELSNTYKIRAITRDTSSAKAEKLKEKAEVAEGNMLDRVFLSKALTDVHAVFLVNTPVFGPNGLETEYNNIKTVADVAVERYIQYLIFNTLPSVMDISSGKYKLSPFDAKAKAEQYIRTLPIKSAFYCPGFFMENFASHPSFVPHRTVDDSYAITLAMPADIKLPYISAVGDGGKFVGAILAEPGKYKGKIFCAASGSYNMEEVVAAMSKATGKKIVHKQISIAEFKASTSHEPEFMAEMLGYYSEFKHCGPETDNLMAWAIKNARDGLTTLEEYFEAHPLLL